MIFPEFSLLQGTAGSLRGQLSLRVDVSQRKVPIRQAHPAFVLGKQLLQGRRDRQAVGTLEIGKLHDDHRSFGFPRSRAGSWVTSTVVFCRKMDTAACSPR